MYSNVVVGINGLPGDRDAIALGRVLAATGGQLALVNVRGTHGAPTSDSNRAMEMDESDPSNELLHRQRDAYAEEAETVSVLATSVGAGLHQVALGRGADVIVVGGCHRGAVGRVLAGDDARSALHDAPCAVAVAPAGFASGPAQIAKIGLAYDASEQSEVALAHAALLAADLGAKLHVREVVALHVYGTAAWGSAAATIEEDPVVVAAAARGRIAAIPGADVDVVVGAVLVELEAFSAEVDLIVCGSRQRGAVKRVLLGSTSDHLAHNARCALLVTPAHDECHVEAWHELREAVAV
jgi:nucleotide-binding universal stress UspA family protein